MVHALALAGTVAGMGLNYGPTPQAAARSFFGGVRPPVSVVRTNTAGRYATVLVRGAIMESEPLDEPLLFEKFSFGWQAVQVANFHCRLAGNGVTPGEATALLRGMPPLKPEPPCRPYDVSSDAGPAADVDRLRARENTLLIPSVRVAGDWALAGWYGAGGGEHLYHRTGRSWRIVSGGGGALGAEGMRDYGVPKDDWCALGIYDVKCP